MKSNTDVPIVTVLNQHSLFDYLIMVFSLRFVSKISSQFIVINDGTLTRITSIILQFIGVRIVGINKKISWQLLKFTGMKLFHGEVIYIVPDVTFLRYPQLFFKKKIYFYMEDIESRYSFSNEEIYQAMNLKVIPKVNTGIIKLNSQDIQETFVDEMNALINKISKIRLIMNHFLEQTAYAIFFILKKNKTTKNFAKKCGMYSFYKYEQSSKSILLI